MSMLVPTAQGACPSCETAGQVGKACREKVCQRQGIHFVPYDYAQASWEASGLEREVLVGQFVGDFLVLGRIGKGGFGRVLLALQRPLFRLPAAVKLLEFGGHDAATTKRIIDKFENEAAVLAVLNHPNIVRLLNYGLHQDRPYLAMEFVPERQTLQTMMNGLMVENTSIDPTIFRQILNQVLDGLEAAHQQHIIHRDIKPENIMLQRVVGNPYHVKLLDFGLAKFVNERRDTSMVMGTVNYMAPEQIEARNIGPWTDLYSTGCITFEFMTGHSAFTGNDSQEVFRQKLTASHDVLAHVDVAHLPPLAVDFLRRALAYDPAKRYRSTSEFRAALNAVYDSAAPTLIFARDLSHVVDSEELGRLRAEKQKFGEERRALDAEREKFDSARRALDHERKQLDSTREGRPADVESKALGKTIAIPSVAGRLGAPPPAAQTQASVLQTGIEDRAGEARERLDDGGNRRRWAWLGATAALVGLAIAGAMIARSPSDSGTSIVAASPAPSELESTLTPTLGPAAPSPESAATEAARVDGSSDAGSHDAAAEPLLVLFPPPAPGVGIQDATGTSATAADVSPKAANQTMLITVPPGAEVWTEKGRVGHTPFRVSWRAGEASQTVFLKRKGYVDARVDFVAEDAARSRSITLRALPVAPRPVPRPVTPTPGFEKPDL